MPARLTRIIAAATEYGIRVEKPKKGSHWVAKRAGARSYTIPAHNGERSEITDLYIAGFCRNFGLDLAEFKKKL